MEEATVKQSKVFAWEIVSRMDGRGDTKFLEETIRTLRDQSFIAQGIARIAAKIVSIARNHRCYETIPEFTWFAPYDIFPDFNVRSVELTWNHIKKDICDGIIKGLEELGLNSCVTAEGLMHVSWRN